MEIISVAVEGALEHKDSEGNTQVIKEGDIQIMSAGPGIRHSEYNHSKSQRVNFLQIWIFPDKLNIKPGYDQKNFSSELLKGKFKTVVSPELNEDTLWINQKAYISKGIFEKGNKSNYNLKIKGNGIYLFVIKGSIEIDNNILINRDAIGIEGTDMIEVDIIENSELLLIEVPIS